MLSCSIAVADATSMYVHQIVAGFTILSHKGQLEFSIREKPELRKEFYHQAIIEVFINGKRIIYDLADGYNNYPSFEKFDKMLDNLDFYFKACFFEPFHENMRNKSKIFVLAPRYYVTTKFSPLNVVDYRRLILNGDRHEFRKLVYRLPFVKNALNNRCLEAFEMNPNITNEPKVFFYTRLWNPEIASSYSSQNVDLDGFSTEERIMRKKEEYFQISELRSGLVRTLKKEFGSAFIGGVSPDEYSKRYCPELIGSEDMSQRKKYTKQMHAAQICVNTQGTHKCWNFSFGEELAASKAIVTEKPFYAIPTFLKENVNFYTYNTVDTCVEKVYQLFSNKTLLSEMMYKNQKFYEEHLRPDKYVADTLEIVLR